MKTQNQSGFNMVEVTLAMGVVALALAVILGLMPEGINASQRVQDETIIASLAADVVHWRKTTPFNATPWFPSKTTNLLLRGVSYTNYFDAQGVECDPWNAMSNPLGIRWPRFEMVSFIDDHPDFALTSGWTAQLVVKLRWPVANTNTYPYPLAAKFSTRTFYSIHTVGSVQIYTNAGIVYTNLITL